MGACTSTELQVTGDQSVIISASLEACWSVISDVTTVAQWNAQNIKSVDLLSDSSEYFPTASRFPSGK